MSRDNNACFAELRSLFADRFVTHSGILTEHGRGEAFYPAMPPDAVIYPHSTDEVSKAVQICARYRVPMIPYGAGTSLEGHVLAVEGGVCFDLIQMHQVLRVNTEDLDCTVQAGVTRKQLNTYLRETGLMFPIDPGADASLGGMIATNASGTNAVRYGTMKDMVINLTAVLANGEIVKTGNRARKSAAGYDLTRLLVGTEGTLGIITEATLKLYGVPEAATAGIVSFKSLDQAVNTVILSIQQGLPIGRIELLDEDSVRVINHYFSQNFSLLPTLWFEFSGSQTIVREQVKDFLAIAEEMSGECLHEASAHQERNRLWDMRHKLWYAALAFNPGKQGWSTDVCVPISRLAECIVETRKDIDEKGLYCPILGHVGDGNFHVIIMFDGDNPDEIALAKMLNRQIVERALSMEGSCTGEHGIGLGKIDLLEAEMPSAIAVMRAIKQALDPNNLLNPGKIFH